MSSCFIILITLLICVYSFRTAVTTNRVRVRALFANPSSESDSAVDPNFVKSGLPLYLELKQRPAHFSIPRPRMDLQFAVQLMRNSYNFVDYLDFTAMDGFQKNQFLFRQAEWEAYRQFHPSVLQGDLANAQYFDFISFCQHCTINYCINNANGDAFVEQIGAGGEKQVVTMYPMLDSKDKIRNVHQAAVGNALLDYILSTYPSNIVPNKLVPVGNGFREPLCDEQLSSFRTFVDYARQILDIFAVNSYTSLVEVNEMPAKEGVNDSNSTFLSVKLQLPANMWGQLALRKRKELLLNDFEMKVLKALARRCRLSVNVISTNVVNNIDLVYIIKVSKKHDEAFHKLMASVYEISDQRNNVDNPIVTNIKRGNSPLPPSNTYIEKEAKEMGEGKEED
jgi:hypothetical protein